MATARSPPVDQTPKDFEDAIEECGFGLFNVCLLLVAMPCVAAMVWESSTMSYILPTAECDLHLNVKQKGYFNAITYIGMISSAVIWGYIADTTGRKRVLVFGLLTDSVIVLLGAVSQTTTHLMIFKFLGGFVISGPFAVIMSYISEMHGKKHRGMALMAVGVMLASSVCILPIMAYAILPIHIAFDVLGLNFHTWQIFIALTSFPSLLSGVLLSFFPESPKYLMAQGRNEEALESLKFVYAMNKRRHKDSYPVASLFEEAPEKTIRTQERLAASQHQMEVSCHDKLLAMRGSLAEGLKELKPMFLPPLLGISVMVYLMQLTLLVGHNSIRLWLPQLFASMVKYEETSSNASSMCAILDFTVKESARMLVRSEQEHCDVHLRPVSYVNNIIVGAISLVVYIMALFIVRKIDAKFIINFCLAASLICSIYFYWLTTSTEILVVASAFITLSAVAVTATYNVVVNIYPTTMRTIVVALIMTFGRLGSILGTIVFPYFVSLGCLPPILFVSCVLFCACLISLFLPQTSKFALK